MTKKQLIDALNKIDDDTRYNSVEGIIRNHLIQPKSTIGLTKEDVKNFLKNNL